MSTARTDGADERAIVLPVSDLLLPGADRLPTLDTEHLRLRAVVPADAPDLFAVFGDPVVCRYWSRPPLPDLAAAVALQREIDALFAERTLFQWAIAERESDRLVGTCTLADLSVEHRRAALGYALGRAAWGRGHATQALRALLAFAFDALALHRIEADADPRNAASIRVLERLGFRHEGHQRERWHLQGEVQDAALYGLLAREWRDAGLRRAPAHGIVPRSRTLSGPPRPRTVMTTAATPAAFTPPTSLDHHAGPQFADLDREIVATRTMLAVVPDDRLDWAPHPKSMSLGRLASHIAESSTYVTGVLASEEYDMAVSGRFGGATLGSVAEVLALFDRTTAEMRAAIAAATPASLDAMWTLRMGDHVFVHEPRRALVRDWGISHLVHHRAQLGVYLRLLDVHVPGMYGPSADDEAAMQG